MGSLELTPTASHDLRILGEVVDPTQEISYTIANNARTPILHMPYQNQVATTGNFASPLSPHEIAGGPVVRFNVYRFFSGTFIGIFPATIAMTAGKPNENGFLHGNDAGGVELFWSDWDANYWGHD